MHLEKIDKKTNKPKIWLFKDRDTGAPKGEATITYDDPSAADAAIQWFNSKFCLHLRFMSCVFSNHCSTIADQPFNGGSLLKVSKATRKNNFPGGFNRGRGAPRGGGGSFGGRDSNGGGFAARGAPRGGGGRGGSDSGIFVLIFIVKNLFKSCYF